MRYVILSMVVPGLLLAAACQANNETSGGSRFWDSDSDVRGSEALIDFRVNDLADFVATADVVAVISVDGVESVETAGPLPEDVEVRDPEYKDDWARFQQAAESAPLSTTYKATAEEAIVGSPPYEIRIEAPGGLWPDGTPSFIDGWFLLEPGRTYLLSMSAQESGSYGYSPARGSFDLTEGVRVLNHPTTRDLESLESMDVDEFIEYIRKLAAEQG